MTRKRPEAAVRWLHEFGERLREVRLARGMSQRQLSMACTLSQPFISDAEQGRSNPTLATIRELADALEVPAADLLLPPGTAVSSRK